jgi:hypothetical protein
MASKAVVLVSESSRMELLFVLLSPTSTQFGQWAPMGLYFARHGPIIDLQILWNASRVVLWNFGGFKISTAKELAVGVLYTS